MILLISIPITISLILGVLGKKIGKKGGEILIKIYLIFTSINLIYFIIDIIKENKIIKIITGEIINIGIYKINMDLKIERNTLIMITLIIIISNIVIYYSIWYMGEENNKNRFIMLLIIFTISMLYFIISSNYFTMFIGWEYVGLISFLLINYWYINYNNTKSGIKAILINKIGDISYIIFLYLFISNNNNYTLTNNWILNNNNYIIYFLFLALMAKSSQIFLHLWLGDAMAGPTPVSALLHAATMVTAGAYLLINYFSHIIIGESPYNYYIIIIGLLSIILGGISAINQYDIKKIIAYSTISQIGYMVYSISINEIEYSLFHLFIHGFFKALLFLSAGIIIHNYYNEQDIRKLGNFIFYTPLTYIYFLIGTFSIISFPFFSGYYSKELIIQISFFQNLFIIFLINLGVLFTIIYSFNLIYHIFFKFLPFYPVKYNYPSKIIILLLFGSLFFGYFFFIFLFKIVLIIYLLIVSLFIIILSPTY